MWTVIYMGNNIEDTKSTKEHLTKEGFFVKVRQVGKNENAVYELLVLTEEVEDAHEVLNELKY